MTELGAEDLAPILWSFRNKEWVRIGTRDILGREPIREVEGLRESITSLGPFETPGLMASASELIFEGLHLHQKLNKDREGGRFSYHA